ncbi:hypothetical protein [Tenacibaculum holothuriorum]|uniref:hypothetical protein n=1 Tax=Tenacibaculum holothuriorum TaxID=1635173 RepID=UPI001302E426|nr:hypothetical protein [Tenacibaculum holothuriorum]
MKVESSDEVFLKIVLIKNTRMYAINKIENAFTPPRLEKASTQRPNKKDRNKNGNLLFLTGYKNTNAI